MLANVDDHFSNFVKICFLRRHYLTLLVYIWTLESVFLTFWAFKWPGYYETVDILFLKVIIYHGCSAYCPLATVAVVVV